MNQFAHLLPFLQDLGRGACTAVTPIVLPLPRGLLQGVFEIAFGEQE